MKLARLLAVTLVVTTFSAAALMAGPKIKFLKTSINFGTMSQNDKFELVYPFKNVGDAELVIGTIHTSCGCTDAVASKSKIPPGGTGEIKAVFHSGSFNGPVVKTITVQSNDPESTSNPLKVEGVVKKSVETFPEVVNIGDLPKGKTYKRTIVVKAVDSKDFVVKSGETRSDWITVGKPRKSVSNKGAWEVPIEVDSSNAPIGRLFDAVQINTTAKNNPTVYVRVMGKIVQP